MEWKRGLKQPTMCEPHKATTTTKKKKSWRRRVSKSSPRNALFKTEECSVFKEFGECPYKNKCQSAQGKEELRKAPITVLPSAYKTVKCRNYWGENTVCPYGRKCKFAHEYAEGYNASMVSKSKTHAKYRTKICHTFELMGACPYGDKCSFIHPSTTPPDIRRSLSEEHNDTIILRYEIYNERRNTPKTRTSSSCRSPFRRSRCRKENGKNPRFCP